MKKNVYYRTVFRRENKLKKAILEFFLGLCSYPRLVLEVFMRKNFGERYFTLASAITVAVILLVLPFIGESLSAAFSRMFGGRRYYGGGIFSWGDFFADNTLWFLFVIGFGYCAYLRWREVKRNPSVFDFSRFSLCTGDIHPFFYGLKISGKPLNIRYIEIFLEPVVFFIPGVILWLIGQSLGPLLVISSVCYSLSYAAAYNRGDNFVMDRIDEMILNEEMQDAFVEDKKANNARGARFYARKPNTKELREQVADSFVENEELTMAL